MTSSSTIRALFTEARKYGVGLVAAAQSLYQLDREVVAALLTNVGTIIAMRCGNVGEARLLQQELGQFSTEDLLDLAVGKALVRMGPARDAFNLTIPEVVFPETDFREEIIAASRQQYCRPRAEVEAALRRPGTADARKAQRRTESLQPDLATPYPSNLTTDQWRMLEYLADHPAEALTAVYRSLNMGVWRGNRIRQELQKEGLLLDVKTHLGQGRRQMVFLVPTIAGLQAVNKPLPSGRGGALHRYFQDVVANHARALGYVARVEHQLASGGSVDVHLSRGAEQVAVEIAIQSRIERELKNLRKCLEAGYHRILALFLDPGLLNDVRSFFTSESCIEDRRRVFFAELGRLEEVLK